ncbi:MAG: hypothetical protein ACM3N9_08515 [Syntrophothermus sp.]
MKSYILLLSIFIVPALMVLSSCSSKEESKPCNNLGTLCIENKMDSTVNITLKPINSQFTIQRDYMKCSDLQGNTPYTITIATPSTSRDTLIFLQPCDNKLLILH